MLLIALRPHFKLLIVFIYFTRVITVNAAEIRWIAGSTFGADWNVATNWDLGRVPVATDSVLTFYGDLLTINTGYTARCSYLKLIGNLNIVINGKLVISNGQFDALGDVVNYGMISIANSPKEGLIFSTQAADVTFENYGEIYIDQAVEEGFVIRNDQIFTNKSGGYIEISNAGLESFKVGGTFENSGTMRLGTSGIGVALSIDKQGAIVENQLCGKMQLLDQFEIIDGTLNNLGFFRQNYDALNNFSSTNAVINNYGVVEDLKTSFKNSDFDVQTIWISPLESIEVNTGEPTIPFVNNFPINTLYSDIYADNLLTQNAGSYDELTNTWVPNAIANGLSTFFIEISQNGGSCADTVRFDLENPVLETVYWIGGTGNWQTANKWSTGSVPTIDDRVGVYNTTDDIFIPLNTDAFAKQVFLAGELTVQILSSLNIAGSGSFKGIEVEKGTLINNGTLLINNCEVGIDMLNATFTNNNVVTCSNTRTCLGIDQITGLTALFTNSGTFSNTSGDLIHGDDSEIINTGFLIGKFPIVEGVSSDNLRNEGTIEIEGDGSSGIGVDGDIINETTGIIFAEKLDVGVEIKGSNRGAINTQLCYTGIEIKSNFENFPGGEMEARNSNIGVQIYNGTFENLAGASLKSKKSSLYGLLVDDPIQFLTYAHLINEGEIEIDSTTGVGLLCMGDFTNQGSGLTNIRNSDSHGIHVMTPSASLVNNQQAEINIVLSGGSGLLQEGGLVDNKDSAKILVDRATLIDVHLIQYINLPFMSSSNFKNNAFIKIE